MVAYLILLAIFAGLGAWLPAPGPVPGQWRGLRLFGGIVLADVALYGLAWLGGVPLHLAAWALAAAAAAGALRGLWRRRGGGAPSVPVHPALVLPLLFALVLALRGGAVSYVPFGWDEFSNWQRWTFEMIQNDRVWQPGMASAIPGYTPGLPLLMALPSLLLGRFDEANSVGLQFLMHVGLLAMVWDLVRAWLAPRLSARGAAEAASWLAILALLAVEAGWKLFPTLQLVEKPQIYAYSAFVVLMLATLRQPFHAGRLGLAGGLILVHGFLIKLATQLFLPAAALLALLPLARLSGRDRVRFGLGLALPVAAMLGSWKLHGIPDPSQWNSLVPLLATLGGWGISGTVTRAGEVAHDFLPALGGFLLGFKPWLTLVALGGLALAWRRREARIVALALGLFLVLTEAVLFVFHMKWVGYHEINSIDRFTRVPLRPIHLFGLLIGFLCLAEWLAARWGAWRHAGLALALPALVLLGHQAFLLDRGLALVAERPGAEQIRQMRDEAAALAVLLRDRPAPAVQVIEQGGQDFAAQLADYYSLRGRYGFRMVLTSSWGPVKDNPWRVAAEPDALARSFRQQDALWPVRVDGWIMPVLARLTDDARCRADPVGHFLVRRPDGGFDCVPKAGRD